jgi:hypothetical protein
MAERDICDAAGCRRRAIAIVSMLDTVLCAKHLQDLYHERLPIQLKNGRITKRKDGRIAKSRCSGGSYNIPFNAKNSKCKMVKISEKYSDFLNKRF